MSRAFVYFVEGLDFFSASVLPALALLAAARSAGEQIELPPYRGVEI
jgi:hypothetical protein